MNVVGRNEIVLADVCSDGSGPYARVTSDTTFVVGARTCTLTSGSCTLTWNISAGSGSLSSGTFNFSLSGTASGCGFTNSSLTLSFTGTQGGSTTSLMVTSLSPANTPVGSGGFTLTVIGTGFTSSSMVLWNGVELPTTYLSSTMLTAQVPSVDLSSAGNIPVTVSNGAATSNAVNFGVTSQQSAGLITSIAPASMAVGSSGFTLTVTGTGFASNDVVLLGGTTLPTTYVSSTTLTAQVPAQDLLDEGTISVGLYTAAGWSSNEATFTVTPQRGVSILPLGASDMVVDSTRQLIYLSLPNTAPRYGNSIAVLDPTTGTVTSSQFAGSQPNRLAVSDDGGYLYVGIDGASLVRRFILPALLQDIDIPLGSGSYGAYTAGDVEVAPAAPHTIAVLAQSSFSGPLTIYDDATARATTLASAPYSLGCLQWGANASTLYGSSTSSGSAFYALSVNSSGVTLTNTYSNAFTGYTGDTIHYDASSDVVYSEDGQALNPATGLPEGTFGISGRLAIDAGLGTAFFVSASYSYTYSEYVYLVSAYDLTKFTPIATSTVVDSSQNTTGVKRVVRFGTSGLAFLTNTGDVVLLQIPVATPSPAISRQAALLGLFRR